MSSLQVLQENLNWETATATLIQEFDEQMHRSGTGPGSQRDVEDARALYADEIWRGKLRRGADGPREERRKRYKCGKVGHLIRSCYRKGGKHRYMLEMAAVDKVRPRE